MQTIDEALRAADEKTIRALADNMNLAPSNDVRDTEHWLREHAGLVGIAAATQWYTQCAVSRDTDPFVRRLDWKEGIVRARGDKASQC